MTKYALLITLFAALHVLAPHADADYTEHTRYRSVLDAHPIRVTGEGRVDVPFRDAVTLFLKEDLLDVVQHSYARQLPAGEGPEFEILPAGDSLWTFVNKKAQTSIVEEIHRDVDPESAIRVVYYSQGKRFFGLYRSIVEISIQQDAAPETSRYEVTVHAYPENSFIRFFARHLGSVEKFFHAKTDEITDLSVKICRDLASAPSGIE